MPAMRPMATAMKVDKVGKKGNYLVRTRARGCGQSHL